MLGFKRGGVGYVLIKTDTIHENVTSFVGNDGKLIHTDVTYLPQQRTRIYGTVIQTPVMMGSMFIRQIPPGTPGYGAIRTFKDHDMDSPSHAFYKIGGTSKYKYMSDIIPEVQNGDKIYFKWRVMSGKNNMVAQSRNEPKEYIFKVPYDQIYCIVRDGKIIPVGGHVLIDPEVETFDEILVPTFFPHTGPDGKPVVRPKDQWLQKKAFPENKERIGSIMHVGKPMIGDMSYLKPGMRVLYKLQIKSLHTIEEKKYIVLRQDKLIAKLN